MAETRKRGDPVTWARRLENLRVSLGRDLTTDELLLLAPLHDMTPGERRDQAESWQRGMRPTGDPQFD